MQTETKKSFNTFLRYQNTKCTCYSKVLIIYIYTSYELSATLPSVCVYYVRMMYSC